MKMICSHCGQPLPEKRLGVRLTPLKARIFDLVKRAGPAGIFSDDLLAMVFPKGRKRGTLKSHIWQINELIADEGYRIKNDYMKDDGGSCYILVKE